MKLRLTDPRELRDLYDRDLKTSFPPAELKPAAAMLRLWEQELYRPLVLAEGDEVLGECFLWLGRPGWAVLDYLCVAPGHRDAGLGAVILREMCRENPGLTILAEAEAPELAPDPELARRRLGFYRRNGARLAGYEAEAFGVCYKVIYWSPEELPDEVLSGQHRFVYENTFSKENFQRYVRLPREPGRPPLPQMPWDE